MKLIQLPLGWLFTTIIVIITIMLTFQIDVYLSRQKAAAAIVTTKTRRATVDTRGIGWMVILEEDKPVTLGERLSEFL